MREPLLLPLAAFMAGILASPLLGEGLAGPALAGAFFLLLAATAYLCWFGFNLVRVQQEADWQLRVALVQSYADYQQAKS